MQIFLWLAAELAIIASDVPEVIGTAFAIKILFGIPTWVGIILTGLSTLVFLTLQVGSCLSTKACDFYTFFFRNYLVHVIWLSNARKA